MSATTIGTTRTVEGQSVDAARRDVVRLLASRDSVGLKEGPARAAPAAGNGTLMFGHFAVFNRWTEIDSMWEGRFLEQIAPGAFTKTFKENRNSMRVLAEHGGDPTLGNRALGTISELSEDAVGAAYEVPLVDASDVRDLILPRLRAGLYGASFRFRVMREEIVDDPEASDDNPHGLQERTIKEARVFEFGPVTFPAYEEASASVRSVDMTFAFVPAARSLAENALLMARVEAIAGHAGVEIGDELRAAIMEGGARALTTSSIGPPKPPDEEKEGAELAEPEGAAAEAVQEEPEAAPAAEEKEDAPDIKETAAPEPRGTTPLYGDDRPRGRL